MVSEVLDFSRNNPPLYKLASIASSGAGLSLTSCTDRSTVKFSEDASYLISLAILTGVDPDKKPAAILRSLPKKFLNSLSYTAIVALDDVVVTEVKEVTDLTVLSRRVGQGSLVVITGLLSTWHDAVVTVLENDLTTFELRVLMDKILLCFEKVGLSELWYNYSKKPLNDQSFLLIRNMK